MPISNLLVQCLKFLIGGVVSYIFKQQREPEKKGINDFLRPLPELSCEGPMKENWKDWIHQFLIFLDASKLVDESQDAKGVLLLHHIGPAGVRVHRNFVFENPNDSQNLDILINKFDNHFRSIATKTRERYVFFSTKHEAQTIDEYVKLLKFRAKVCHFGEQTESLIKDKIVLDVKNKKLRNHLLGQSDLTLDQTISQWKTWDFNEKQSSMDPIIKSKQQSSMEKCGKCGTLHGPKDCPAHGQKCDNCGMMNHWTTSCNKPTTLRNTVRSGISATVGRVGEYVAGNSSSPATQAPARPRQSPRTIVIEEPDNTNMRRARSRGRVRVGTKGSGTIESGVALLPERTVNYRLNSMTLTRI